MHHSAHTNDEPLTESALLAWRLAPQLCYKDPATEESCSWAHGLWPFLRLTGLGSTAGHRADFYGRAIRAATARTTTPRILVSGTADYAMLEQVIAAFRGTDARPEITVLDICETPLRLNDWYANRVAHPVETIRTDILDYRPGNHFDLVCTDSFLGRFPHAQWPALAAKWHSLLRPGGHVVTASRLRGGDAPAAIGFPEKRAKALRETMLAFATRERDWLAIEPEALARCADLYAARHVNYPVRSKNDVRIPFEGAGFDFDELTTVPTDGGRAEGIRSPSVASDATFLKVIARRR